MNIELIIDQKEIPLNNFVKKILIGMLVGAVKSLRGITDDWKEIKIRINK